MRPPTPDEARGWWALAESEGVRDRVFAVYDRASASVEAARPVCSASGRCCDFERAGHDLFVTGLEAAVTLRSLPGGIGLDRGSLEHAIDRGTCPFLGGRACLVHGVRPGGCRGYYCDPTTSGWSAALSERIAMEIRTLHDTLGVDYLYSEWRRMLGGFVDAGLTRAPQRNARGLVELLVSAGGG
ncbi:MAG: hypothetical protein AAF108_04800 [Planctomycetota bacterium]